jgi:hypothetical protein
MLVDTSYLREKAQRCVALARICPDSATSHALEALGVEWMEKAAEIERREATLANPSQKAP